MADPMGVSAAPAKKRSFAGANAYRSAMPSYRPNQGGSTYGAPPPSNDDYTRAPPRLSVNDLCEEAGGAEAPTFGAESDAQFAEDEPQPDAPMAQPEHGAAAATTAAEALEEDEAAEQAQPMVVPFLQPVEQRGGLDWFQVCETDQAAEVEPPAALPVTGGKDGVPALEEDGSLHMYWLDAFEDPYNAPGTVYLFGKVRSDDATGFSSCAVVVKGLERNVFVLPRERHLIDGKEEGDEVTFQEVYQEMAQVCRTHKITRFGCKKVERAYAFEEKDMPFHADYLKLVYSAEMAALPMDLEGKTFRKIFGAKTSCLERLLLKRKVMGPCWLKLDGVAAINSNTTWCKFEVGLTNKKSVSVLADAPPPAPPPPAPPPARLQWSPLANVLTCADLGQVVLDQLDLRDLFAFDVTCTALAASSQSWLLAHIKAGKCMCVNVACYDLPDETLAECIIKSIKADEEFDYEVAHGAETKALFMLLDAVRAGRDAASIAGMAKLIDVAIKRENRGSRWFA